MYYAQIDPQTKICFAVTETHSEINDPNMIPLNSLDEVLGHTYVDGVFVPPEPVVQVDPCEWLIDLGPYFDRFGSTKMAVLTSTDAGVKAIIQDASIRKWIDLRLPAVAQALAYIGSVIPAVDATLQSSIINTPVTTEENRALRKLFF